MSNLRNIYNILLEEFGRQHDTVHVFSDKGSDHTYIEYYEKHLSKYRDRINLFEIGIMTGGSALLWRKYFKDYKIESIDISPTWSSPRPFQQELLDDPKLLFHFNVDSTDKGFASRYNAQFDAIIDDGDHEHNAQLNTFKTYWHALKPGGQYFIEDVRGLPELTFLQTNIVNFLSERKEGFSIDNYMGNVNVRSDDIILTITKR